ncbi:MAG TPA: glycosyl hydrolase [Actinomycetota bacterium]|nr:glycosyl hydrolase [Actinomycetota bacterium]
MTLKMKVLSLVSLLAVLATLTAGVSPSSRVSSGGTFEGAWNAFLDESDYFFDHGKPDPIAEAFDEMEAPEDAFLFQRAFGGAIPTRRVLARAAQRAKQIAIATNVEFPELVKDRWTFMGPASVGARVVDIAVDPKLEDTIYTAAATGGVWKSTDTGMTYKPIWDDQMTQSMGALAIGSGGTLYAGTGEANPGGGSLTYGGDGIYRSDDRGKTWKNVGLKGSSRIGRIFVDPKDDDHVLVAATGHLFKSGGVRGLYETKNGGDSWKQILAPENETTGAIDIAWDPKNPDNIFVAMWDHIRYPDRRIYAGLGSGLFRSSDGGKTFTRLGPLNGLPPSLPNIGRISVAIDPSDPAKVYTLYVNDVGTFSGFFMSADGGATWLPSPGQATLADSQSVYGWWFGRMWVDPEDGQHIFATGLPLMESTDGGLTFPVAQSQQHVDHHAMAWDPHTPGRVYNGNDGGVYVSDEGGADRTWRHATYQPWSQFFTIDVSEQDPIRINGGLQDNGSIKSWGRGDWSGYYGGDGVKNAINPEDMNNVFACSQYGACGVSFDGGRSMESMDSAQNARNGWLTPIEFQPGDANVVYYAGSQIHRSLDKGATWQVVSQDLGNLDPGLELNPLYAAHYGTVQALGLNEVEPGTMYAGTDNGLLWKTESSGESDPLIWTQIGAGQLPGHWITHIAVEPDDPDVLYISFSGFRSGDENAYVMTSRDGGTTFKDVTRGLPKAPVNDLVLVGDRLFAATDVGVFTTSTKSVEWHAVGRGLPLVPVNDLRYISGNDTLYAGTFGRGIYAIEAP